MDANEILESYVRDVAACLPNLLVHQDSRVDAVHIVTLLDKHPPPELQDITLQRHTEWTVIPRSGKSAVNFRTLVNKTSALT